MTQSAMTAPLSESSDASTARGLVDERIVLFYFVASLIYMVVSMLAGWFFSLQFLQVYAFPGIELMSPGRLRMVHTNGVVLGFIANAFLGAMHWAIPRLTLHPVRGRGLSWFIFVLWQLILVATIVGLLLGHAQAVKWGETPVYVDPIVMLGLLLIAINFIHPILKAQGPMYVTQLYFIAALAWTGLVYAMGNFVPEYLFGGVTSGAIIDLYIRDLVGLFITPIGLGMMYYFVPDILGKPIWSHRLALMGFLVFAFSYPLAGIHHIIHCPVPMFLRYGAYVATLGNGIVVATVIINFFGTIRHCDAALRTNIPIRWFYLGIVFYLVICLQYAFLGVLTLQPIIHFTDWVVGHSHLALFGVFGFWIFGVIIHLFPRLLGATGWWRDSLNAWHFWLTGIGLLIMFVDLVTAGLMQGFMWRDLVQWESTVVASRPFWLLRTITGVMILAGQIPFALNILMTAIHKGPESIGEPDAILPLESVAHV